MYWSCCQSTGAEIRKYLTAARSVEQTNDKHAMQQSYLMRGCTGVKSGHVRLSTCWRATTLSGGRLCCASWSNRKVSGATDRAWGADGYMLRCNTILRWCLELGTSDVASRTMAGGRRKSGRFRACQIGK
jgi:hypothetical protein